MENEAEMKLAKMKMKSSEDIERQKVSQEIDTYAKESPEEVAKLIKAWLTVED
jgi:flagellar M-ring protein FliF